MNIRTLPVAFTVFCTCLVFVGPVAADDSKKKPKEIVVVGSKVKDVVREAGSTSSASLNPPALDDRGPKELATDQKERKDPEDSSPEAGPARQAPQAPRQPKRPPKPAGPKQSDEEKPQPEAATTGRRSKQ